MPKKIKSTNNVNNIASGNASESESVVSSIEQSFGELENKFKKSVESYKPSYGVVYIDGQAYHEFNVKQGLKIIKNYAASIVNGENSKGTNKENNDNLYKKEMSLAAVISSQEFLDDLLNYVKELNSTINSNKPRMEMLYDKAHILSQQKDMSDYMKALVIIGTIFTFGLLSLLDKNKVMAAFSSNVNAKKELNTLYKDTDERMNAINKQIKLSTKISLFANNMLDGLKKRNTEGVKDIKDYFYNLTKCVEKQISMTQILNAQHNGLKEIDKRNSKSKPIQVANKTKAKEGEMVKRYAKKDNKLNKQTTRIL